MHRELLQLAGAGAVTLLWRDWGMGLCIDPTIHPLYTASLALARQRDEGAGAGSGGGAGAGSGGEGGMEVEAGEAAGANAPQVPPVPSTSTSFSPSASRILDEQPTLHSATSSLGLHPSLFPLLTQLHAKHARAVDLSVERLQAASTLLCASARGTWEEAAEVVAAQGQVEREGEGGAAAAAGRDLEAALSHGLTCYMRGDAQAPLRAAAGEAGEAEEGAGAGAGPGSGGAGEAQQQQSRFEKAIPPHLLPRLSMDASSVVSRLLAMLAPAEMLAAGARGSSSSGAGGAGGAGVRALPRWLDASAWSWALPIPVVLLAGRDGESACHPIPVPNPIINALAVARVLQGLPSPLCSAREWRTSSPSDVGSLWGRWMGWDFDSVLAVAARVVAVYGASLERG